MRTALSLIPLLSLPIAIVAGDAPVATEPAPAPAPAPAVSEWSHTARLGIFMSSVSSTNQLSSNDPSIAGTKNSTTWLAQFKGTLNWEHAANRVEQSLEMKYGQQKTSPADWTENSDLIEYRGAYKRTWEKPHYMFFGWGADSVFSGPQPAELAFDPLTLKASAGYGQHHEFNRPEHFFDGRLGVRVQKTVGTGLSTDQREVQTGLEAVLRYEDKPPMAKDTALNYFIQYEGFSQFKDLGHITNLLTAGVSFKLAPTLTVDVGARAYFETEPKDVPAAKANSYNTWSYRQETLVGLTWDF